MKKIISFALLTFSLSFSTIYAQDKKVAIVTFYADKRVGLGDLGLNSTADLFKLEEDPNFNMSPLLASFHTRFFDDYVKNFPFQIVPEAEVTKNEAYKNYVPIDRPLVFKQKRYTPFSDYQVIEYNWGTQNEKNLLKIFNQYDGIMFVSISFEFMKNFAFNGTGTVKIKAYANIVLLNKDDKKVFNFHENANSKKLAPIFNNIPVMTPEKILPMCESALDELMKDLQKKIPKLIKKSEEKL